jgi:hypothetical protein
MSPLNVTHFCLQTTSARIAWVVLSAALLSGCGGSGPEVAPVSGRVTLDGAPFAGARIRFQPEAGGGSPSYGAADRDGNYVLGYKRNIQGAQPGIHTVTIQAGAGGEGSTPLKLPARYNTQTELRKEVKSGEDNTIDFELKSDPK